MGVSGHRDCAGSGRAHAKGSPCRQCHMDPAIAPSLLLGPLWSQALPTQTSTSAPEMAGWILGSKSQTAKIPLVQGDAKG